jgi:hypothetical protein
MESWDKHIEVFGNTSYIEVKNRNFLIYFISIKSFQYAVGIMVLTVMNRSVAYLVYENSDQGLGH